MGGGGGGLAAVVVAALDGDEAGGVGEEPLGAVAHPLRLLLVNLQTDQLNQRLVEKSELMLKHIGAKKRSVNADHCSNCQNVL